MEINFLMDWIEQQCDRELWHFSILITRNAPDSIWGFEEGRRRKWERRGTISPRSPVERNPQTHKHTDDFKPLPSAWNGGETLTLAYLHTFSMINQVLFKSGSFNQHLLFQARGTAGITRTLLSLTKDKYQQIIFLCQRTSKKTQTETRSSDLPPFQPYFCAPLYYQTNRSQARHLINAMFVFRNGVSKSMKWKTDSNCAKWNLAILIYVCKLYPLQLKL